MRKIYYDFENRDDNEHLDAFESPKISSPAEDLELQKAVDNLFDPRKLITIKNSNP